MSEQAPGTAALSGVDWLAIGAAVVCLALLLVDLVRHGADWTVTGE